MGYDSKYNGSEVDNLLEKAGTAIQEHQDISHLATKTALESLQAQFNALVSNNAKAAIESFNEIIAFLAGVEDTETLEGIIASIEQQISDKYSKPGSGIPNSDLANSEITISGTAVRLGGSITQSALRTALGLGSNAYTSTSYLPTTGTAAAATKLANKRTIWGQEFDGTGNITGDMTVPATFNIKNASVGLFSSNSNGNIGIRTSPSTSYKVNVAGNTYFDSTATVNGTLTANSSLVVKGAASLTSTLSAEGNCTFYKALYMYTGSVLYGYGSDGKYQSCLWPRSGDITYLNYGSRGFKIRNNASADILVFDANDNATFNKNVTVSGTFTNPSSLVLKDIVDRKELTLEQLSAIKLARFTWKDKRDDKVHLGAIADEVKEVMPEVVHELEDGTFTMEYANAAFAMVASLVKYVEQNQQRIAELEKEIAELKKTAY